MHEPGKLPEAFRVRGGIRQTGAAELNGRCHDPPREWPHGTKFPKAAAKVTDGTSCWRCTTTPPSTGCTCEPEPDRVNLRHRRHRTKVTKGPGSRAAGQAMAFRLIESAQEPLRMVNAPHLVGLVRAGGTGALASLARH